MNDNNYYKEAFIDKQGELYHPDVTGKRAVLPIAGRKAKPTPKPIPGPLPDVFIDYEIEALMYWQNIEVMHKELNISE